MKPKYLLILFLITVMGCKKEQVASHSSFSNVYFTNFKFQSANNPKFSVDILAEVDDTLVSCSLPLGISPDSLIATFETNELVTSVTVNGTEQESGSTMHNFITPVTYTLHGRDNSVRNYRISVKPFTGLPIIYLTTDGGTAITSKDDYVTGNVFVDPNYNTGISEYRNTMQIRIRGNTSANLPKKPYKLKLTSKGSILGMPEDKEWALLANYDDKTLIRNTLAYKLSEIFELPYTPRSAFAEIFLNGVYQGNYQISETVKIAANRVNIKSMDETDISGTKLTGGYLFEVDSRLDGTDTFVTDKKIGIVIHDPEYGQAAQINYLKTYVQQLENTIYSSNFADPVNGYAKYMNASSAIGWFWVNEISRNLDAQMNSSVFMYKERSGLLNIGPVWDFDLGFGNTSNPLVVSPEGWYVRDARWFAQLFHDPKFTQDAVTKWSSVRAKLDLLNDYIDNLAFNLKYSEAKDAEIWNNLNVYINPTNVVTGSYKGEIAYLKSWLSERIKWIDNNMSTLGD